MRTVFDFSTLPYNSSGPTNLTVVLAIIVVVGWFYVERRHFWILATAAVAGVIIHAGGSYHLYKTLLSRMQRGAVSVSDTEVVNVRLISSKSDCGEELTTSIGTLRTNCIVVTSGKQRLDKVLRVGQKVRITHIDGLVVKVEAVTQ